jgi:hypothetical protein
MKFSIQFGETEKNLLEYRFNQLMGASVIELNHQVVRKHTRWFSEPIEETYEIEAGVNERWRVKIEKQRKLLYGQVCRVFLNSRLFRVFNGV